MTVQITIVGLGQIGSSMGLALKARNLDLRVVGHDKDPDAARESQKLGAVDDVKYNLPASVRGSKIVVLALPFAEIRQTLDIIAPDLQEGSLVLDTASSKETITSWARELLPQGRYYMGLAPAINPEYLHGTEFGVKAARADLFEKGLMGVSTPSGIPGNVFNVGMEFISLIGAVPLLLDTAEVDGIFAAIHLLPQLAANALLDATLERPGWQEARKLAGRPYAAVTSGLAYHDDALSLRDAVTANRENVVRLLNNYITSLLHLRDAIEENDQEGLLDQLETNWRGRVRWFDERNVADWLNKEGQSADTPTFGDRVNQMLFGSMFTPRKPQK
jgi:prephenate dehydrogenase